MSARDVPVGARPARVFVVLLALLCLATGALVGWQLGREAGPPPSYLAQVAASLELRPEQVSALEAVLAEEDRRIDALLAGALRELDVPVAAQRRETEAALVALLDTTQRARYEELLRADGGAAGAAADAERGR